MAFRIFIVEDDPWLGKVILHHLGLNPEFELSLYTNGQDAINDLYKSPNLLCIDYVLPDMEGDRLLKSIRNHNPHVPVIVMSAQDDIAVAVRLLKQGATDYISKGEHFTDLLWKSVAHAKEHTALKQEVEELKEELEKKYAFAETIIGQSTAIKSTFNLVQKAIDSQINVSISGETGTGKEVYAKAIHFNSSRKRMPFVAINMAAIPHDLAESELFGHEKGAFTGAVNFRKGKLEEANGGTLFLDEIADMDLTLQSKLLRVLQEREIVRIGGNETIPVDFRLISASHKKLSDEVNLGRFREDLYFRIFGLPIHLPPLRDRQNDILILSKYFADEYAKINQSGPYKILESAKLKLKKHPFMGNVRELKACIELACVMCEKNVIGAEDITFHAYQVSTTSYDADKTLKDHEILIITDALRRCNGNVVAAAAQLDISKSKIYQYIKEGLIFNQ